MATPDSASAGGSEEERLVKARNAVVRAATRVVLSETRPELMFTSHGTKNSTAVRDALSALAEIRDAGDYTSLRGPDAPPAAGKQLARMIAVMLRQLDEDMGLMQCQRVFMLTLIRFVVGVPCDPDTPDGELMAPRLQEAAATLLRSGAIQRMSRVLARIYQAYSGGGLGGGGDCGSGEGDGDGGGGASNQGVGSGSGVFRSFVNDFLASQNTAAVLLQFLGSISRPGSATDGADDDDDHHQHHHQRRHSLWRELLREIADSHLLDHLANLLLTAQLDTTTTSTTTPAAITSTTGNATTTTTTTTTIATTTSAAAAIIDPSGPSASKAPTGYTSYRASNLQACVLAVCVLFGSRETWPELRLHGLPGPSLHHLLTVLAVEVLQDLDGGSRYGMPETVVLQALDDLENPGILRVNILWAWALALMPGCSTGPWQPGSLSPGAVYTLCLRAAETSAAATRGLFSAAAEEDDGAQGGGSGTSGESCTIGGGECEEGARWEVASAAAASPPPQACSSSDGDTGGQGEDRGGGGPLGGTASGDTGGQEGGVGEDRGANRSPMTPGMSRFLALMRKCGSSRGLVEGRLGLTCIKAVLAAHDALEERARRRQHASGSRSPANAVVNDDNSAAGVQGPVSAPGVTATAASGASGAAAGVDDEHAPAAMQPAAGGSPGHQLLLRARPAAWWRAAVGALDCISPSAGMEKKMGFYLGDIFAEGYAETLLRLQLGSGQMAAPLPGTLPPSPPPDVAAAVAAGLLPTLERLIRVHDQWLLVREFPNLLAPVLSWPGLAWMAAYDDPRVTAALVVTLAVVVRRLMFITITSATRVTSSSPHVHLLTLRLVMDGLRWAVERRQTQAAAAAEVGPGGSEGPAAAPATPYGRHSDSGGSDDTDLNGRPERQLLRLLPFMIHSWLNVWVLCLRMILLFARKSPPSGATPSLHATLNQEGLEDLLEVLGCLLGRLDTRGSSDHTATTTTTTAPAAAAGDLSPEDAAEWRELLGGAGARVPDLLVELVESIPGCTGPELGGQVSGPLKRVLRGMLVHCRQGMQEALRGGGSGDCGVTGQGVLDLTLEGVSDSTLEGVSDSTLEGVFGSEGPLADPSLLQLLREVRDGCGSGAAAAAAGAAGAAATAVQQQEQPSQPPSRTDAASQRPPLPPQPPPPALSPLSHARALLRTCANPGCYNLAGASAADLVPQVAEGGMAAEEGSAAGSVRAAAGGANCFCSEECREQRRSDVLEETGNVSRRRWRSRQRQQQPDLAAGGNVAAPDRAAGGNMAASDTDTVMAAPHQD